MPHDTLESLRMKVAG